MRSRVRTYFLNFLSKLKAGGEEYRGAGSGPRAEKMGVISGYGWRCGAKPLVLLGLTNIQLADSTAPALLQKVFVYLCKDN